MALPLANAAHETRYSAVLSNIHPETGWLGRQDSDFCSAPQLAYRYHAARRVAEDRASDAAFFARGDLFDISHLMRTPERTRSRPCMP